MAQTGQVRTYDPATSVVFLKTKERFGGLSNMAPGFPLRVNGVRIRTSEALYQACRFPHRPDVQRRIIDERSPMTAKMKGKPFREHTRSDWDSVRVKIMRWCLRVKLAQNWDEFSRLLLATGDRSIVEQSRRDDFWGAKPTEDGTLVGTNALGRLLMELREHLNADTSKTLIVVEPPPISEFLLFARPIETVWGDEGSSQQSETETDHPPPISAQTHTDSIQPSFFDRQFAAQVDTRGGNASEKGRDGALAPYASYRESGVEWLGEVPEHWEVRRLRNLTEMRVSNVDKLTKDGERPVRLCNYMDVYKGGRIRAQMPFMKATATTNEIERFRLRVGDVLITKDSESWNDIGVPALVSESAPDLISGYHLALLRPREQELSGDYLLRALQSKGVAHQFHIEAKGVTRFGLTHSGIKSVWLPLPPLPEQVTIVRFLDHADRRIRRYIRAKEKLIALLEEQKQVIIHQAVTGRIDVRTGQPYPAYKPSGVEWLGDVPGHWEVISLRATAHSIQTGPFGSQLHASDYVNDGTPVINPSHLRDGAIHADDRISVNEKVVERLSRHKLLSGDIVLARRGELGRCALVSCEEEGWLCGTGSLRIRPKSDMFLPPYLLLSIDSQRVRDALKLLSIGATMENLSAGMVSRLRVLRPSLSEQAAIVNQVNQTTAMIGGSIAGAERQISLLHEFRTAMIADVVTGKLDVREVAAALPEFDPLAIDDEADDPLNAGAAPAFDDDRELAEVVG